MKVALPLAQAWRKQLPGVAQGHVAAGRVNGKTAQASGSQLETADLAVELGPDGD